MKNLLIRLKAIVLFACMLASCKNGNEPGPSPNNKTANAAASIADMISGSFSGTGKKTSNEITNISSTSGCLVNPPGIDNYISTGSAQLQITKVSDSTIDITFTGGPFTLPETHERRITKSGNLITVVGLPEEELTYDTSTKQITAGMDSGDYFDNVILGAACTQGLPFYYGEQVFGGTQINYLTLAYAQFSGAKQ